LGDPETGFRFQYKVILENEEEAAQRPDLHSWFLVLDPDKP
jgi:hypothetical protein